MLLYLSKDKGKEVKGRKEKKWKKKGKEQRGKRRNDKKNVGNHWRAV